MLRRLFIVAILWALAPGLIAAAQHHSELDDSAYLTTVAQPSPGNSDDGGLAITGCSAPCAAGACIDSHPVAQPVGIRGAAAFPLPEPRAVRFGTTPETAPPKQFSIV